MSLLDDFETLEQKQVDSIDYYLRQMVIKDKYPIAMSLDVFYKEYFHFHTSKYGHCCDLDGQLYSRSNLMHDRVYMAAGENGCNASKVSKPEYGHIILIGTIDEGFRKIEMKDLQRYFELYEEQWPDCDYI